MALLLLRLSFLLLLLYEQLFVASPPSLGLKEIIFNYTALAHIYHKSDKNLNQVYKIYIYLYQ